MPALVDEAGTGSADRRRGRRGRAPSAASPTRSCSAGRCRLRDAPCDRRRRRCHRSERSMAAAAGPRRRAARPAMPLRTVATSEFVVPRSMPTARRVSCGSGDASGSAICSRAIGRASASCISPKVVVELGEEPQFAHAHARRLAARRRRARPPCRRAARPIPVARRRGSRRARARRARCAPRRRLRAARAAGSRKSIGSAVSVSAIASMPASGSRYSARATGSLSVAVGLVDPRRGLQGEALLVRRHRRHSDPDARRAAASR